MDIITTTFGKALGRRARRLHGGLARGDRHAAPAQPAVPVLELAARRPSSGATLRALELLSASTELRDRLEANTKSFRERMTAAGFEIKPGVHPIVPIMFSRFAPDDAPLAQRFARALLDEGVYVKGFFFPVVPKGLSRIRVQLSAAHRPEHIDRAVAAFTKVGKQLGVWALELCRAAG